MMVKSLRLTGNTSNPPKIKSEVIPQDTRKDQGPSTTLPDLDKLGLTYDQFDQLMLTFSELEKIMRNKNEMGLGAGMQIERYCGIRNTSDYGKDCQYAKKAAQLFLAADYLPKLLGAIKRIEDARKRLGISDSCGTGGKPPGEGQ